MGESLAALPGAFRTWDAAEYVVPQASYQGGYRAGLPTALEMIDPGCQFCAQLYRNARDAGLASGHNVTYIVYPIGSEFIPRFANSALVARYLTAVRLTEHEAGTHATDPTDWAILDRMFGGQRPDGVSWQVWFNDQANPQQAQAQLQAWLAEAGYDRAAIDRIAQRAHSDATQQVIDAGKRVVDEQIQTVTIPSMIVGGDLHKGSISVDDLRGLD